MAISVTGKKIVNQDNSVGSVGKLTSYDMDTHANSLAIKYHNLKNQTFVYDESTGKGKYTHSGNASNENKAKRTKISKLRNITGNLPLNFNERIQNFFYSPPSDNLWNVEIQPSSCQNNINLTDKTKNLAQLYQSILAINGGWRQTREENWKISMNAVQNSSGKSVQEYLSHFNENEIGLFLAQKVAFTPFSINHDKDTFGELQQQGGFFKNAKVVKSRKDEDTLKLTLLVSNWDICEILFDPWIAAVAQHGLIADETPIKAKIILTEYSSSYPKFSDNEEYDGVMKARKQYIFDGCFPISRDETTKNYDLNEAGTYKNSVVTFSFDDYQIHYLF